VIVVRADKNREPAICRCGGLFYTPADEPHETILVACSKCDWLAPFQRDDLIASHGTDWMMWKF
jgi:hypothetical protein